MDAIRSAKEKLRTKIQSVLKNKKEEELSEKSRSVMNALFRNRLFKRAKTVMFYLSISGEVDTSEMIKEALRSGKKVVVPVCGEKRNIVPCTLKEDGTMLRGPYGILEPALKTPVALKELDLIIVPGLAFDEKGGRLGRGKGYYDAFLAKLPTETRSIGLAYDFQVLPSVPTADHDVNVHKVIFA
ncbi:MAG: 5-formyltetrahydrofolate cyclo-ligase [Deltaproteobacteria bacterium]